MFNFIIKNLFCNKLLGTTTPVTCHPMIFWRYFWEISLTQSSLVWTRLMNPAVVPAFGEHRMPTSIFWTQLMHLPQLWPHLQQYIILLPCVLYAVKAYAVARCLIPEEPPPCAAKEPPMRAVFSQPWHGLRSGQPLLLKWDADSLGDHCSCFFDNPDYSVCTGELHIFEDHRVGTTKDSCWWEHIHVTRAAHMEKALTGQTHASHLCLFVMPAHKHHVGNNTHTRRDWCNILWTQTGEIHACMNFLESNTQSAARYMARCVNLLHSWCPSTLQ